jgi:hypothetical protein
MYNNGPGIDGQIQMSSLPGAYAPGFAFYVAGDYSALTKTRILRIV